MDPGFYEDLAGRLYGLLIRLEGRISYDAAWIIHEFIDSRHYGLALQEIAQTLSHGTIAVTGRERADLLALADRVDELAVTEFARPTAAWARVVITDLPVT